MCKFVFQFGVDLGKRAEVEAAAAVEAGFPPSRCNCSGDNQPKVKGQEKAFRTHFSASVLAPQPLFASIVALRRTQLQ